MQQRLLVGEDTLLAVLCSDVEVFLIGNFRVVAKVCFSLNSPNFTCSICS